MGMLSGDVPSRGSLHLPWGTCSSFGSAAKVNVGPVERVVPIGMLGTGFATAMVMKFTAWIDDPRCGSLRAISGVLGLYFLWFPRTQDSGLGVFFLYRPGGQVFRPAGVGDLPGYRQPVPPAVHQEGGRVALTPIGWVLPSWRSPGYGSCVPVARPKQTSGLGSSQLPDPGALVQRFQIDDSKWEIRGEAAALLFDQPGDPFGPGGGRKIGPRRLFSNGGPRATLAAINESWGIIGGTVPPLT